MVKSEVCGTTPPNKPYPKMMINNAGCSGMVVLFEKAGKGVVVYTVGTWNVGEYRDDWAINQFVDFDGKITLSGE